MGDDRRKFMCDSSDVVCRLRAAATAQEPDVSLREVGSALRAIDFVTFCGRLIAARLRILESELRSQSTHYRKARRAAMRGLHTLRRHSGYEEDVVRAEMVLGMCAWFRGDPRAAGEHYASAVDSAKAGAIAVALRIEALGNLALCLHETGDCEAAEQHYRSALGWALEASAEPQVRTIRRRLANLCQDVGRFSEAAELMYLARPDEAAAPRDQIRWLNPAAMLAEQCEDLSAARAHYASAIEHFYDLPTPRDDVVAVLSNAALLYIDLGDTREGERLLALLEAELGPHSPLGAQIGQHRVRARLAMAAKNIDSAILEWKRAEALLAKSAAGDAIKRAEILVMQAELLWAKGAKHEAIDALRPLAPSMDSTVIQAHQIRPIVQLARFRLTDGEVEGAGEYLEIAFCHESLRRQLETEWRLMAVLADWAEAASKRQAAILFGKMSISAIRRAVSPLDLSVVTRLAYLSERLDPFRRLVDRLIDSGRFPEAASIQAMIKSERLFHFASRDVRVVARENAIPMTSGEASFAGAYAQLSQSYRPSAEKRDHYAADPAKRAAKQLLEAILADGMEGAVVEVEASLVTPDAPDLVVLRFLVARDRVIADAATNDRSMRYEIALSLQALHRAIFDLLSVIQYGEERYLAIAGALFEHLIRPAENLLAGRTRLEIAVGGVLTYLPFCCLYDGSRFLVQRVSIAYRTGVDARVPERHRPRTWRVAALGASQAIDGLPSLSFVRSEIAAIQSMSDNCTVWLDEAFSRATLREAIALRPQILHLACHYHLEPAAAYRSFLSLGDGTALPLTELRRDGFEFRGIEVLVLAGCNTATPDRGEDGAIESLAALCQSRGAETVIGTLWPVSDAGSATVMSRFYEQLLIGGKSPSAESALARAQAMLAGSADGTDADSRTTRGLGRSDPCGSPLAHPYYWAGFAAYVRGS